MAAGGMSQADRLPVRLRPSMVMSRSRLGLRVDDQEEAVTTFFRQNRMRDAPRGSPVYEAAAAAAEARIHIQRRWDVDLFSLGGASHVRWLVSVWISRATIAAKSRRAALASGPAVALVAHCS